MNRGAGISVGMHTIYGQDDRRIGFDFVKVHRVQTG
jgi:hypothetical protein